MFADVSSGKHAIGSRPDHPESGLAHDPDVLARLGLYVARIGKFEYGLFRVADQPGAVEGDMVCSGTEQAKVEGFMGRSGYLGLADGQEPFA